MGNSLAINAQYLNDWQVGINVTPFIFTRFSPDFTPEKLGNKYPNGWELVSLLKKTGTKTGVLKLDLNIQNKRKNIL